jgi:hypothetical protein
MSQEFCPTGFSLVPHCLPVPMSLLKLLGQQLTGPGGDVRVVILGVSKLAKLGRLSFLLYDVLGPERSRLLVPVLRLRQ